MSNHTSDVLNNSIAQTGDKLIQGDLSGLLPDFSAYTGVMVLLLAFIVVAGGFLLMRWYKKEAKSYKYKVRIVRDFNGRLVEMRNTMARDEKIDGDLVTLKLKDTGELIPKPRYQSGNNVYTLIELVSGKYKNYVIPTKQMVNDKPTNVTEIEMDKTDLDMQYMTIKRYHDDIKAKKMSMWQKHALLIGSIIFIVVCVVGIVVMISQMSGLLGTMGEVTDKQSALMSAMNDALENINSQRATLVDG